MSTLHQLRDDEWSRAVDADIVDRSDIGVLESGGCLTFAFESLTSFRVLRHVGWQDLEGNVSTKAEVVRPVDFAHSAGPQGRDDLIRSETRT